MSKIQLGVVAFGTLILELLGGWDGMLKTLIIFVVLDYFTGVLSALYNKGLSSQIGYKGIIKKVSIFVVVVIACVISETMKLDMVRSATIVFYISNEGISILENIAKCDVEYPDIIKKILEKLKKGDDNENKQG